MPMRRGILNSQETGRVPMIVYVLDVVLAVALAGNMWSFFTSIAVAGSLISNPEYGVQVLYLLISSVYISLTIIYTMMTLQSARKESWRYAARRIFLIGLTGFLNEYVSMGVSVMRFCEAMILVIIAYMILFLPGVRKYYSPPLSEEKSLFAWIKYILIKPKDWNYTYTFDYKEE